MAEKVVPCRRGKAHAGQAWRSDREGLQGVLAYERWFWKSGPRPPHEGSCELCPVHHGKSEKGLKEKFMLVIDGGLGLPQVPEVANDGGKAAAQRMAMLYCLSFFCTVCVCVCVEREGARLAKVGNTLCSLIQQSFCCWVEHIREAIRKGQKCLKMWERESVSGALVLIIPQLYQHPAR